MFQSDEEFHIHNLCSKDIQHRFKILSSIYQHISGNNIDELTEVTKLSRKTIYKYIQIINSNSQLLLEKDIISSDNNLYWFNGNKVDFVTLRLDLFKNTTPIKLIEALLQNSSVNVYQFCLENFVSESTLKKNLRVFNSFMASLNIKLKVQKNEIYLIGDEAKIRYCFASFFWRIFTGVRWPFKTLNKDKLDKVTSVLFTNVANEITESKKEVLQYLIAVNILRASSGHNINLDSLPEYSHSLTNNNQFFYQISQKLMEIFSLSTTEIQFIVLNFYIFPEFHIISEKMPSTLKSLNYYSPNSYNSIINFKNSIQNQLPSVRLEFNDENLFLATLISGRIAFDLFKEIYFHIYDLDFIKFFKGEFPALLPTIQEIVTQNNKNISRGQLKSLVFRYAQAYLICFPPQNFEPKINILLITDLPIYIENLLIKNITLLLSSKYNFDLKTFKQKNKIPDLILTTDVITKENVDSPTLYISHHLSQLDSHAITIMCGNIAKAKKH